MEFHCKLIRVQWIYRRFINLSHPVDYTRSMLSHRRWKHSDGRRLYIPVLYRLATDLFRSLRKIAVRTNFFLARSAIDEFLPSFPAFLLLRIFACSTNMIIVVSQQEKVARCSLIKRGEPWEEWYSWYLWDQVLEDIIFFLFNRSGKAKILCCDISRFFECEIRLTLCSYRNKKMCRWKLSKIWYQFGEFRLCTDRWDF